MSRVTLYGWLQFDETLFDNINFPGDKQTMIDCLIEECGDLYTYIQQPEYLKRNITNWFNRLAPNFTQMFRALSEEYSPIENYNRYEDINTQNDSSSSSGESTIINNSAESAGDRTDLVSAYDSSGFQNEGKTEASNTSSNASTNSAITSSVVSSAGNTTNHTHGNIGVTTNQQMVLAELELRKYDIYYNIARMFEKHFLIQIY